VIGTIALLSDVLLPARRNASAAPPWVVCASNCNNWESAFTCDNVDLSIKSFLMDPYADTA
jgi:hypothetical protein